jgi:hypothetical protein
MPRDLIRCRTGHFPLRKLGRLSSATALLLIRVQVYQPLARMQNPALATQRIG